MDAICEKGVKAFRAAVVGEGNVRLPSPLTVTAIALVVPYR
jgi:hypothetical protein